MSFVTRAARALVLLALAACSNGQDLLLQASPPAPDSDAGATTPLNPDAGSIVEGTSTPDAGVSHPKPQAGLRLANLVPGSPAFDFCLAPHGTSAFTTPVLQNTGLAFGQVSDYLPIAPGLYDLSIIGAGTDCSTTFPGSPNAYVFALPAFADGSNGTVAVTGYDGPFDGPPYLSVQAWLDERVAPAGSALLRFIHASPGTPAVDVGLGRGVTFEPLFQNLAFNQIASGLGFSNGYAAVRPLSQVELSARPTGTATDAIVVGGVDLPAGTTATAFAIGVAQSTDTPLAVLLCIDSAAGTNGNARCTVVGPPAPPLKLRVIVVASAPMFDICLAEHGTGRFLGPFLWAVGNERIGGTGFVLPTVTQYFDASPGQYDVRVVDPMAGDCTVPYQNFPDAVDLPVFSSGMSGTFFAMGDFASAGDAAMKWTATIDTNTVMSGYTLIRLVQGSPDTGALDFGVEGFTFIPLASAQAFRDISPYVVTQPMDASTMFALGAPGAAPLLSFTGVELPYDGAVTVIWCGTMGDLLQRHWALICLDTGPGAGANAPCSYQVP